MWQNAYFCDFWHHRISGKYINPLRPRDGVFASANYAITDSNNVSLAQSLFKPTGIFPVADGPYWQNWYCNSKIHNCRRSVFREHTCRIQFKDAIFYQDKVSQYKDKTFHDRFVFTMMGIQDLKRLSFKTHCGLVTPYGDISQGKH